MIRRIIPGRTGPTGGPAFTDLLGVCTSWDAHEAVVQPEDGPPVTIPLSLVVSGKPVPPRPSVRHRVSVREAELHTAALGDIETAALVPGSDWQLRYEPAPTGRLRNRFNSCLAVGEPGLPLAEAAAQVRAFYTTRDRVPLVQVELDSSVEAGLRGLGWTPVPGRDNHFLLASLAQVRRALASSSQTGPAPTVEVAVSGAQVVARIEGVARGEAGLDASTGSGGTADWLGIHNLAVDEAHRRRGLARAVLSALLEWGAEQGARTAWLHVQTDNAPALALYESLGFAAHHSCRYLQAPQR